MRGFFVGFYGSLHRGIFLRRYLLPSLQLVFDILANILIQSFDFLVKDESGFREMNRLGFFFRLSHCLSQVPQRFTFFGFVPCFLEEDQGFLKARRRFTMVACL